MLQLKDPPGTLHIPEVCLVVLTQQIEMATVSSQRCNTAVLSQVVTQYVNWGLGGTHRCHNFYTGHLQKHMGIRAVPEIVIGEERTILSWEEGSMDLFVPLSLATPGILAL